MLYTGLGTSCQHCTNPSPKKWFCIIRSESYIEASKSLFMFGCENFSVYVHNTVIAALTKICCLFALSFSLSSSFISHLPPSLFLLHDLCHSLWVVRSQLMMMMHLVSHCLPGRVHLLQIVCFYQHAWHWFLAPSIDNYVWCTLGSFRRKGWGYSSWWITIKAKFFVCLTM